MPRFGAKLATAPPVADDGTLCTTCQTSGGAALCGGSDTDEVGEPKSNEDGDANDVSDTTAGVCGVALPLDEPFPARGTVASRDLFPRRCEAFSRACPPLTSDGADDDKAAARALVGGGAAGCARTIDLMLTSAHAFSPIPRAFVSVTIVVADDGVGAVERGSLFGSARVCVAEVSESSDVVANLR